MTTDRKGIEQHINDLLVRLIGLANRIDPWIRPIVGPVLRGPVVSLVQRIIVHRRRDLGLALCEERILPGEEEALASIIDDMSHFTRRVYADNLPALRAGNTKTYGAVRATFEVLPNIPTQLRHGVLAEGRTYPAWVRFASGASLTPPDVDGIGIMSMAVKLMDVPGEKLLEDEKHTQDFLALTTKTFPTPDVIRNAALQRANCAGKALFYFIGPRHSHLLDGIMQLAYAKTQASPLQEPYYSCTPYLLGPGQAIQFSFRPVAPPRRRPPVRFSANYLQSAMVEILSARDVVFELEIQVQVDPRAMPIEDASVIWPSRLSPGVPVARLTIPRQVFNSPAQMTFAESLSFNPWHSLPDHRPLGNQNRARRKLYYTLSRLRHEMNGWQPVEPTGNESFEEPA